MEQDWLHCSVKASKAALEVSLCSLGSWLLGPFLCLCLDPLFVLSADCVLTVLSIALSAYLFLSPFLCLDVGIWAVATPPWILLASLAYDLLLDNNPSCSNPSWTETVTAVANTSAALMVEQR